MSTSSPARVDRSERDLELPEACADFVGRLASGEWFGGWKWRPGSGAFESTGSLGWRRGFQALLDRTDRAFVRGDFELAAAGYGRLLPSLELRDAFGGCEDPLQELRLDPTRAVSRWCRSVLDLGPEVQRGQRLVKTLQAAGMLGLNVDLRHIRQAHPEPPPAWPALLPRLRLALLQSSVTHPGWVEQRRRLLEQLPRSAVELEALAHRARRAARSVPSLWLEWIEALELEGHTEQALEAAREALDSIAHPLWCAEAATRAARLSLETGGEVAPLLHRAWRLDPVGARLVRWAASLPAEALEAGLRGEQEATWQGELELRQAEATLLELLLGDWEVLGARLDAADPSLWDQRDHPGPVVVPAFLGLGLGGLPAPRDGDLLGLWRALAPRPAPAPRTRPPEAPAGMLDAAGLSGVLLRRQAADPTWRIDAPWFRARARSALVARTEVVLRAGDREEYEGVARLARAWVELARAVDERRAAAALLTELHARYPRHRAYRSLLPEPPAAD